jgi:excisionase family DNA binding protein
MSFDYTNPNQLLTREQAGEFLGVSRPTLEVWACTKRYNLKYIKIGKNVRYRMSDLLNFLEEQTRGGN